MRHEERDGHAGGGGRGDRSLWDAAVWRSGLVAEADEEDGTNQVGMWLVDERPDLATDYVLTKGVPERLLLDDGRTIVTHNVGYKAAATVRVRRWAPPGHSSSPYGVPHAVAALAELIGRLVDHRPRRRLLPATQATLESLIGPVGEDLEADIARAGQLHRALGDLLEPLFSTTIAPTRLHGSDALNVLPARASVDCDCRVLPGTSIDELLAEVRQALGDDVPYELDVLEPLAGGTLSPIESPLFDACRAFIQTHDPGAILLPTLCSGFTDSHYLRAAFGSHVPR